jgi:transcriptional regulator with XRE-family HTH domain
MEARSSTRTVTADGEAVKRLRLEKGWRIEDLAKRARCSIKTVENVERGANVYLFTLKKFAEALDVEYKSLLPNADTASDPQPQQPRFVEVQIKLSIPYGDFDESEQLVTLIRSLNLLLEGKTQMGALNVAEGSTIVTLEMDAADVGRLIELLLEGELEALQIIGVNASNAWSGELEELYARDITTGDGWIERNPKLPRSYWRDRIDEIERAKSKKKRKPHV